MTIKGFPLIKFQNANRIQDLQNGLIYMNSLEWYRKDESDNLNNVVGDSFEGMFHINEANFVLSETGESIKITDELMMTSASNDYVYCMFGINPYNNNFTFTEEQKETIKTFGDTALLILDKDEFFKRIRNAALKENYEIYGGFVHYYDEEKDSVNLILSLLSGIQNIAFWKRKAYAYQQEFRFLIHMPSGEKDHLELNIGNIRDISKVYKTSDILSAKVTKM